MARNPARTFALVNLTLFVVAIAVLIWLRQDGRLGGEPVSDSTIDTMRASSDTAAIEIVTAGDVQPASAAQIDFLNEVLVETSDVVEEGFSLRAPNTSNTVYYVAAPIVRAESAVADTVRVGVWRMRGPRDAPSTVTSVNADAERYSLAGRSSSEGRGDRLDQAAARVLVRHVTGPR